MRILSVLCISAAVIIPSRAVSQERRFSVGMGAGMGSVRDARSQERGAGPMVHLRAGVRLGRGITLMLDGTGYRMFDESLPLREAATEHVLKTSTSLLAVQVGLPYAFYVRPGIGSGDNAYAVERVEPNDSVTRSVRADVGLAGGIAVGRMVRVARKVPVAVEAAAVWSRGGAHTGDRWGIGIQAVPLLKF